MNRRDLLLLTLIALAIRLTTAALIARPGYMDTAYYADGALLLAQGEGFSAPFLWHYLDDPVGLPHPAFLYWMPLPSLLAAPFAALGTHSYRGLQLPFAALSALLPALAYLTAGRIADRRTAWTAALLTIFSGFFFPFWTLPETFAPFALFGSLALYLTGADHSVGKGRPLLIGLLVGLAHLTRADGLLLLPVVGASLSADKPRKTLAALLLLTLGYLSVMTPWFLRNLLTVSEPLPSAGSKTLWLTTYDDLFCYHCDLSPTTYLAWGWRAILHSKLWATTVNLQRFLAEDCLIFLFPFVLIGLYRKRRHRAWAPVIGYGGLMFAVHSWAFTFPGIRGGFFHASAPMLPFLMAVGAGELNNAARQLARRRRRPPRSAQRFFGRAAVAGALLLSLYGAAIALPRWNRADLVYNHVGEWLTAHNAGEATVMVANPPAFWYHTGHRAVVIPNNTVETTLAVAERYGAEYILLDHNHPAPLTALYTGHTLPPGLSIVHTWPGPNGPALLIRLSRSCTSGPTVYTCPRTGKPEAKIWQKKSA